MWDAVKKVVRSLFKKLISLLILIILASLMFYFFNRMSIRPEYYLNNIAMSFKGKIVEKYFLHETHLIVDSDSTTIDIDTSTKELEDQAMVGDSLIKYPNSNCCKLIKGTNNIMLRYVAIPNEVLERSEYLRNINERSCN